jgi:hypothetical protein
MLASNSSQLKILESHEGSPLIIILCDILDKLVTLHEMVDKLHQKKMNGVIFKNDFEKAYGKIKRYFIKPSLRMKSF